VQGLKEISAKGSSSFSPGGSVYVEVVTDLDELERRAADWEDLAAAAIEPNPFFENWMLIPALKFLRADTDLRFVLVFASSDSHRPLLCGLFPLIRHDRWHGLPIPVYSLWKYIFCSLCTPLIRPGYGRDCLAVLFDWLASEPQGGLLVEFNQIGGNGPFNALLGSFIKEHRIPNFVFNRFDRARYFPTRDLDAHFEAHVSSKYRSQLRRKQKRLSTLGSIEVAELGPGDDASRWISDFLELEARGWKGRERSALACDKTARSFFEEVAKEAFTRRRLRMLELRLDGRLLAQRCSFISGGESFLFKVAYNEDFAQVSPGVLLEIENMTSLNRDRLVEDSCAAPDHPVFSRLWADRKPIQTTLASWSRPGATAISAMHAYRWFKRRLPV
jgi:hypothetical protein